MATLENYISLRDGVSPALEKMSRASNTIAEKLGRVAGSTSAAGTAAEVASTKFGMLKSVFMGSFLGNMAVGAVAAVKSGLDGLVDSADAYAGIRARLELVAGSQENMIYLNDMIYESAQRARGGYMDMARAVAQIALSAHDAFPDPRDAVQFTEGIQKLFVIGGTSKANQKDAMLQLTQGLASGQLQGDEFRSISENAPIIEQIVAKSMGVARGDLKQMAADGKVTAEIIKNAVLDNMDEINAMFDKMPKTWGDHFTHMGNVATKAFAPVFDRLSQLANSDEIRTMVRGIESAIKSVAPFFYVLVGGAQTLASVIINVVGGAFDFLSNNSDTVGAALGALLLIMGYMGTMALINAGQMAIAAAATAAKTVADWAETAALIALTFAQDGLNAALLACPLTWIVGVVFALIGVFYLAVAAVNYFADTNISATGLIFGAFAWLYARIYNIVILAFNIFAALANFLGSVFQDPLAAAYNLFVDIWSAISGYVKEAVNNIVDMINAIPGMTKVFGEFGHVNGGMTFERKEIKDALWNIAPMGYEDSSATGLSGYKLGEDLVNKVTGMFRPNMPDQKVPGQYDESKNTAADPSSYGKKTADNTKRMADKLDMTAEEMSDLREISKTKGIESWQQQHITVNIENNNDIGSDVDIDSMTSNLVKGFRDAIAIKRAGVAI